MPKRFTDTDKWKKPFIRGLQGAYKLLWMYVCDDCDHAGIWHVDIEVAQLRIGEKVCVKKAQEFFSEKIYVFDGGTKWFIPSFIEFQYGPTLNPSNKAHNGVINILSKYGLHELLNKPHTSPLQGAKDKDKEKEMDKEKERGGVGEILEPEMNPGFLVADMCRIWYEKFPHYTRDNGKDLLAMGSIAVFIEKQEGEGRCRDTLEKIADLVSKEPFWLNKALSSIANNIQEFYNTIKNPQNDKRTPKADRNGGFGILAEELKKDMAFLAARKHGGAGG